MIAQAQSGKADLLICDIDLEEVNKSPARKMYFRDRRPDIYPMG